MKTFSVLLSLAFASLSWGRSQTTRTWITDCHVFGRHSFISEIKFVGDKQSVNFKLFENKACGSHASTVFYEGSFSTGKVFGEGVEFDSLPAKVEFTVHIQSVIDQYNDPSSPDGCGMKNWKLNVAQDVSGQYCRPFQMPTVNKMVHDIYDIQEHDIRFGGIPLNWDLVDPNNRPQKLSDIVFHKVP